MARILVTIDYMDGRSTVRGPLHPDEINTTGMLMRLSERGIATITFDEPGEYTYQCILIDPATDQQHDSLGMTGTFEDAAS